MAGSRVGAGRVVVVAAILLTSAACGPATGSPSPLRTGEPPTTRVPIIVDADFDQSDLAAIAILLRDPAVDVRAITIAGTGLVHCQAGRLITRYVLDELGASDIPFGCGRQAGGPDAHPFPDDWRARADEAFGLDIPPQVETGVPREASEVIAAAVDASPSAPTVVTLGPLTNLEDAFTADPTLADRVAGIHAMLGTVDAPGNVFVDGFDGADPLEWNAFADPSAVAAVFAADAPISIVPLDATDDVPVPADLAEQLAEDHRAGGADLVYESLVRSPERMADEGQQLWDELTALVLTTPDLVTWEDASVVVGADGRLIRDEAGRSVRVATDADRDAVEAGLLTALRRGDGRETPFQLSGQVEVTFDGTTCAMTGHSDRDGPHQVDFESTTGTRSGVALVGTVAPHTWQELLDLLPIADPGGTPPAWLVVSSIAEDAAGDGQAVSAIGDLGEGFYGPACYVGTWPNVAITPGTPFEVGSGAIGS